jgi:hypothetical protein
VEPQLEENRTKQARKTSILRIGKSAPAGAINWGLFRCIGTFGFSSLSLFIPLSGISTRKSFFLKKCIFPPNKMTVLTLYIRGDLIEGEAEGSGFPK